MPSPLIAIGGLPADQDNRLLERYLLEVCGRSKPRICFIPTASGDNSQYIHRFYQRFAGFGAHLNVLRFFSPVPANLSAFLCDFDAVLVGGGNTRSMLAVWREQAFDLALREAWLGGIVLCGWSAGSICWFEEALSDCESANLTRLDCLSFVPGSNCPHYDSEERRRPTYQDFVASGRLKNGIACDDGVALHFEGQKITAIVSATAMGRAYRVERADGAAIETVLDVTSLGKKRTRK